LQPVVCGLKLRENSLLSNLGTAMRAIFKPDNDSSLIILYNNVSHLF